MKKTLLTTLSLVLVLLATSKINAQEKYALFVHGIFSSAKEAWTENGIPQQWVADKIIAGYDTVFYKVEDLYVSREAVFDTIAQRMLAKKPSAEWILVGHSLGGIVSRGAYDYIKREYPTLNVKTVVTLNSPMQGANIAHASYDPKPGYYTIRPILTQLKNDLLKPLKYKPLTLSIALSVQDVEQRFSNLINNSSDFSNLQVLNRAPVNVEGALQELAQLDNSDFKDLIGRVGTNTNNSISLIHLINNASTIKPAFSRSINTSEKSNQITRLGSGLAQDQDEAAALKQFEDFKSMYSYSYHYYENLANALRYGRIFTFFTSEWLYPFEDAKKRREIWNKGLTSLRNMDATWSQIIDSQNYIDATIIIQALVNEPCIDPNSVLNLSVQDLSCIEEITEGDVYEIKLIQVVIIVPTKSDGFLTVNSMTWDKDAYINDQIKNFNYTDDTPDGGYNHLEVKRYKRAYTLPGVFAKGDYAPPMKQTADWIYFDYQN